LKLDSDSDWVTTGDRLFLTLAAKAGNARLPIVERFALGMTNAIVDDRRCHPETMPEIR